MTALINYRISNDKSFKNTAIWPYIHMIHIGCPPTAVDQIICSRGFGQ